MRYQFLQLSRFLAALWVCIYHLQGYHEKHFNVDWGFNSYGNLGVDFFFALSGFVMVVAHANDLGKRKKLSVYCKKRIIRIYPALIFFTSLQVGMWIITSNPDLNRTWWIIRSYLLLPDSTEHIVNVAWSLRFEMMFYTFFSIIFFIRKEVWMYALLMMWGCLTLIYDSSENASAAWLMFTAPCVSIFCGGALFAYLYLKRDLIQIIKPLKLDFLVLAVSLISCILLFLLDHKPSHSGKSNTVIFISSIFFSSLIYLMCTFESYWIKSTLPKFFSILGDSSYIFYLLHSTLMVVTIRILAKYNFYDYNISWFLLVLLTVFISILLNRYLETPVLKFLRKKLL